MAFGQEIKEFVAGFTTGYKLMDDAEYRKARQRLMGAQATLAEAKVAEAADPEMQRLRKEDLRARSAMRTAGAERAKAMAAYYRAGGSRKKEEPEVHTGPDAGVGPAIDTNVPVEGYARGGMVRTPAYDDGGLVEGGTEYGSSDDSDDSDIDADEEETRVATAAAPYGTIAGHDAIRDALVHVNQQRPQQAPQQPQPRQAMAGPGQPAAPAPQQSSVPGYLRGAGAIGNGLMQQVYDKIDPQRKLSEGARNMAAYSAVYKWYLQKGDIRKARTAVLGMLQQHRNNANHYAAIGKAALQAGNIDAATHAAAKMYANIPNGKDLKFEMKGDRIVYSVTDEATGKLIKKGLMSPQELGAAVMGWTPDKFDAEIAALAGERPAKGDKPAKGEKPAKEVRLSDRRAAAEAIEAELGKTVSDETGKFKHEVGANRDLVQNAAAQIYRVNGDIDESTSVQIAGKLIDPANTLDSLGMADLREEDDGSRTMMMRSGRMVRIPRNVWLDAMAARARGWDAKEKAEAEAQTAAARTGGLQAIRERKFKERGQAMAPIGTVDRLGRVAPPPDPKKTMQALQVPPEQEELQ